MMKNYPPNNLLFDWIDTLLICWFYGGLFVDIWGHNYLKSTQLETFFTPSHYLFYSGFFAIAIFYGFFALKNHLRGYAWNKSLPKGYSLIHLFIFGLGGMVDFLWHTTFGLEKNLDALISPSHLFLGIGTTLLLTGPIRSGWQQTVTKKGFFYQLPLIISLLLLWTCYSVVTEFAHPIFQPVFEGAFFQRSNIFMVQGLGVASIHLQSILLMGILYLNLFRWKFNFGSITLLVASNTVLMSIMASKTATAGLNYLIGGLVCGILLDILHFYLKPSLYDTKKFQLFSFSVPLIYNSMYFVILYFGKGFWSSTHLTIGVILESAVIGWFYSLIILFSIQQKTKIQEVTIK